MPLLGAFRLLLDVLWSQDVKGCFLPQTHALLFWVWIWLGLCLMWFPSYKWNPGTAEQCWIKRAADFSNKWQGFNHKCCQWKKGNSVPMILALFAVDLGLTAMPQLMPAACLKQQRRNTAIFLGKLFRKLPTKQKCFETSCFGYEKEFVGWVFWRRRKRDRMSVAVTCVGLQPRDWSCGTGCWHSWPALIWKGLSLSLLLSVRQKVNQTWI